jgi:hypothetical protein
MNLKREGLRVIDTSEIPVVTQRRTEEWLELLRSIPRGKSVEGTEDSLGTRESVYKIIKGYENKKLIPKGFRVAQRKKGETTFIYIINETSPSSGEE